MAIYTTYDPTLSCDETEAKWFRVAILWALEKKLDGRATRAQVLEHVYDLMRDGLTDWDEEVLPSGQEIRWKTKASWERFHMVDDRLLSKDSAHGVWEITTAGREFFIQYFSDWMECWEEGRHWVSASKRSAALAQTLSSIPKPDPLSTLRDLLRWRVVREGQSTSECSKTLILNPADFQHNSATVVIIKQWKGLFFDQLLCGFDSTFSICKSSDTNGHLYFPAAELGAKLSPDYFSVPREIRLWPAAGKLFRPVTIAEVQFGVSCKLCELCGAEPLSIRRHIAAHVNDFFSQVTDYSTLPRKLSGLPAAVYRCNSCRFYSVSGGRLNPTSAIANHVEKAHRGKLGSFSVITDYAEIVESSGMDLPLLYECISCGGLLPSTDLETVIRHFDQHQGHWESLFQKSDQLSSSSGSFVRTEESGGEICRSY